MKDLSIVQAAREAPHAPAIITGNRTLTFADCARLAIDSRSQGPTGYRELVAHPTVDTIVAVFRALEGATPLAVLQPRLATDELERQRTALRAARIPADIAFVLFTSGSTGHSRGVMLSRQAIVEAAAASAARLKWREDDRWLLCLPMAHAGGLSIVVRCLIARKPIVLHDAPFEAARVHALASAHRATLVSLVPAQLHELIAFSPGSFRVALLGGSAAPAPLLEAARASGWPVRSTYGMTETFGQVATAAEPGELPRVLRGVTITAGETLRIAGPMLASGYLDGTPIAPELVTSDVGSVEGDFVCVLGRKDDIIVTGGEKVHPSTVESVLAATPGVREACVFGVADPRWGHVVGAALVVDAAFSREGALSGWHALLPPQARPRRLALVSALPKLPSGKIDRRTISSLPTTSVNYPPAEISD